MKKRHWALLLGVLAVMIISNIEDYLSSPQFSVDDQDYESIDYYLSDFSLSAMDNSGNVSHTLEGQYLGHWQSKHTSFVILPRLTSNDERTDSPGKAVDAVTITAEDALLNHKTELAEMSGKVHVHVANAGITQFSLDTEALEYRIKEKRVSTEQDVHITSPGFQLSGTGLDSELDQSILRLNANVKSVFQP